MYSKLLLIQLLAVRLVA